MPMIYLAFLKNEKKRKLYIRNTTIVLDTEYNVEIDCNVVKTDTTWYSYDMIVL
jgi:hypothetical protein